MGEVLGVTKGSTCTGVFGISSTGASGENGGSGTGGGEGESKGLLGGKGGGWGTLGVEEPTEVDGVVIFLGG